MSTTRFLAKNTSIQIFGKAFSTVIGVFVVGLMTRMLGQEGFGIYSTANAYFQVAAILIDFGLNVMIVQLLAEAKDNPQEQSRLASAMFSLRLISGLILFSATAVLGLVLPYPAALQAAFFAIWASFFFTGLAQIVVGIHQNQGTMLSVAAGEVFGRLILLLGIILATWFQLGLIPMILIVSLGGIVSFAIPALSLRPTFLQWRWDPQLWKKILYRSWPIGVSVILNLLYYKSDTLILSLVRPLDEVGLYGAAYRVLDIMATVPFMYCGVLLPLLVHAWKNPDKSGFQQLLRQSYTLLSAIAIPMMAGGTLLSERIMVLVAGSDFAASAPLLGILLLATVCIFFGTVSSYAIVALDLQKRMLGGFLLVAILALVLYVTLIPTYGAPAAAWLTVLTECLVAVIATNIVRSQVPHIVPISQLTRIGLATLFMVAVVLPIRDAWLPFPIVVGIFAYLVGIYLLGVLKPTLIQDLLRLRQAVPATGDDPLP